MDALVGQDSASAFQQPALPLTDLVGTAILLAGQLIQGFQALGSVERDLTLEFPADTLSSLAHV